MKRPSALDLTGQTFGRWTVLQKYETKGAYGAIRWLCRCLCGTERAIIAATLVNGRSKSCGCYSTERKRTHNKTRSPIYNVWRGMHKRCYQKTHDQFHNYGAREISVCDRWHTFENFYADMGDPPPGHSIDRINNAGNYEPGNCRWATQKHQIRNKRNTAYVVHEGQTVSLADLCEKLGIPLKRTRNRIAAGWTVEDAIRPSRQSKWREKH